MHSKIQKNQPNSPKKQQKKRYFPPKTSKMQPKRPRTIQKKLSNLRPPNQKMSNLQQNHPKKNPIPTRNLPLRRLLHPNPPQNLSPKPKRQQQSNPLLKNRNPRKQANNLNDSNLSPLLKSTLIIAISREYLAGDVHSVYKC